jgi:hypothetical protein
LNAGLEMLSNREMKPLAKCVMLGVAGLLVAVMIAAAALTNGAPPLILPPLAAGSINLGLATLLGFAPPSSAPVVYLDGKAERSQPLKPGVYQTRPYGIVLIATEPEHDDCCLVGATRVGSKMPVVKPELRAVPILPSK